MSAIEPTTPLRLDVAARLAFPDGSMTKSGLNREAQRGRLQVEKIAGKLYTTMNAINHMRAECRVVPKAPASTSANVADVRTYSSSSTEKTNSALVAAQTIAEALKKPSPPTSVKSINQRGSVVTLQR
ncbi:excisionase [Bradyrhizobium ivorense]|uniref:excisionase n=1 Tax=Bradyrhizobium ivorense TaxID=2511166 RepID=UPI001E4F5E94|nr:excisionase [Bradyrhizobium ivorense]